MIPDITPQTAYIVILLFFLLISTAIKWIVGMAFKNTPYHRIFDIPLGIISLSSSAMVSFHVSEPENYLLVTIVLLAFVFLTIVTTYLSFRALELSKDSSPTKPTTGATKTEIEEYEKAKKNYDKRQNIRRICAVSTILIAIVTFVSSLIFLFGG